MAAWKPEEDSVLLEMAQTTPISEIRLELPWRSYNAISARIRTLGITGYRHNWTKEEEKSLEFSWGDDINHLAQRLGRTPYAVYSKAVELGMKVGCPEGFETLTAAAKRTGYLRSQLQRIMTWAGYRKRCRVTIFRGERHQWIVDSFDVDDAVERWNAYARITETIAEAAVRLGTNHHRVRQALSQNGLALPEKPPRGCHWRIPIATVDEAWACYSGMRMVA